MMRPRAALLAACVLGIITPASLHAAENAAFVAQSVPITMTTGQTSTVAVTMYNNGTTQ